MGIAGGRSAASEGAWFHRLPSEGPCRALVLCDGVHFVMLMDQVTVRLTVHPVTYIPGSQHRNYYKHEFYVLSLAISVCEVFLSSWLACMVIFMEKKSNFWDVLGLGQCL